MCLALSPLSTGSASWRSGDAADCKSVHRSSILLLASRPLQSLQGLAAGTGRFRGAGIRVTGSRMMRPRAAGRSPAGCRRPARRGSRCERLPLGPDDGPAATCRHSARAALHSELAGFRDTGSGVTGSRTLPRANAAPGAPPRAPALGPGDQPAATCRRSSRGTGVSPEILDCAQKARCVRPGRRRSVRQAGGRRGEARARPRPRTGDRPCKRSSRATVPAFRPEGPDTPGPAVVAQSGRQARTARRSSGTTSASNQGLRLSQALLRQDGCGSRKVCGAWARHPRTASVIGRSDPRCRRMA